MAIAEHIMWSSCAPGHCVERDGEALTYKYYLKALSNSCSSDFIKISVQRNGFVRALGRQASKGG